MGYNSEPLFMISVVASQLRIHPQTLRLYEREGFIRPSRTRGNTRLYSQEDVEQIRMIQTLTRQLGVNLAGVQVILELRKRLSALQGEHQALIEYVERDLGVDLSSWKQKENR
ncbi:MAG: helix-turn-helix transcriptional regulator [Candidatus Tectomicrobia bacterium]|nr:helix-turn-helix transcriptional regulator [Candidatus Tectomicrobia bacterium]